MYKRQVSQVTEAGTRIEREYYIDQALTTIQKKKGRDRRKRWCRLLSGETPEPLIPGYTSTVRRSRGECMKTSTHSIAAGVSTVAKLHWLRVLSTLKLFSVNHKNSPLPSLFLFPWFPSFLSTLIQRVTTVIVSTASTVYSMWLLDGYFCFPKFISVPAVYLPRFWEDTDKIIVRWILRHSRVLFTKILQLISLFVYILYLYLFMRVKWSIYDVIVTIHEKIRMYIHISELILYRLDSMILILFLDAIWNN